jgi:serpin B
MKSLKLMAAVAMLSSAACGPAYEKPAEGSSTGFALSFFKEVNRNVKPGENVVVSPYSAGVVLSMLAEGAEGETRVEFDNALNGCLFKAEELGDEKVVVESANSVWVSDDFSVRNRYVDLLSNDFNAFITTQNFADPATLKAINNWCAENTSGKITEIIDRLGPDMVMVLVNALYFNGPWEKAFDPASTAEDVFKGRSGNQKVSMMSAKMKLNYAEYQGCQIVELPYAGGNYSMFVVLPPAGMDADAVLPYVSESAFDAAMGMLVQRDVRLKMPKFKLETSLILNEVLQDMGIRDAFSSAADFKGISAMGPLRLDKVQQKCFIEVAEKGTEAAAVTSAQIRLTSVRPEGAPVEMKVDRPFFFFIADRNEMQILFAGKIVNL